MNDYIGHDNTTTEDSIFIDAWLSKIRKTIAPKQKQFPLMKRMNVSSVKNALRRCLQVVEKLESTQSLLQENVCTMPSEDWKRNTEEIGALRDELSALMSQLQNEKILRGVRGRLAKRARRRRRLREDEAARRSEDAREHEKIERWLEDMKDRVERVKAEEAMKRDADCVLAEVTKKRSEARKQLHLVAALVRLREVREAAGAQRGERSDAGDRAAFSAACGKLREMWDSSARTYAKEEQGLRIMLEEGGGGNRSAYAGREKRMATGWERVLFGEGRVPADGNPVYWGLTAAERDFETFIAIRKSWDTFLCADDDEGGEGSKIPIGWVLPTETADDAWTQHLRT